MNFEVTIQNWNIVSDIGLPPDDAYIFAIWGESRGGYEFSEGTCCKDKDLLRSVIMGVGSSLDGKHIIAWLPRNSENFEIKEITR